MSFARPFMLVALGLLPLWWWLRTQRLSRLSGTRMSDVRPATGAAERLWIARLPATQRSLQIIEDGCVPLHALGAYVAGLREAATQRNVPVAIFGHAGDGHVHVNALPDTTRDGWREALAALFEDVTALLHGWSALWHPAALRGAIGPPRLASPYDYEQPSSGHWFKTRRGYLADGSIRFGKWRRTRLAGRSPAASASTVLSQRLPCCD